MKEEVRKRRCKVRENRERESRCEGRIERVGVRGV